MNETILTIQKKTSKIQESMLTGDNDDDDDDDTEGIADDSVDEDNDTKTILII